ncbi:uncharacterized protein [Primulina eburnea]|uniref:uncharacterized protein n=1 Tax=Primulina eburnea TaxID=1245227 RepID=UPI003C6BE60F
MREEEDSIILLVYERLPNFCYACGRLGHSLRDYEEESAHNEKLVFGAWMRASSHLRNAQGSRNGGAKRNQQVNHAMEAEEYNSPSKKRARKGEETLSMNDNEAVVALQPCLWWKHQLGFTWSFMVDCRGRSGGLALFWHELAAVTTKSYSNGHIDCIVHESEQVWHFTGIYGHPDTHMRHFSWELLQCLKDIAELGDLPWIVGGDFNEICYDSEKLGGNKRVARQMQAFREALELCELQDLHGTAAREMSLEFYHSYHRPICMNLHELRTQFRASKGNLLLPFRFEKGWWMEDECREVVEQGWGNRDINVSILARIASCKNALTNWDAGKLRRIPKRLKDRHAQLNHRSEDEIGRVLDTVEPKIDNQLNQILGAPFTANEVRRALSDMHPDKAPGPDGLSSLYYQKFWDVVGMDVTDVVLRVLNEGAPLEAWNDTLVTLIPKTKNPMLMKEFCRINLCYVCYKIVSRSLTNRLMPFLFKIIEDSQSAFIPGRLITDNIIVGFEVLHWLRCRKTGHKRYGALKLDMSKAYDRVEWDFLQQMMIRLGFEHNWVERIMNCVKYVSYYFRINQEVAGPIKPTSRLRQGDPLSPYLFVLCAHGLSSLLNAYERRDLVPGVKIAHNSPSVSHLFFADDSLVFFKETMETRAQIPTLVCEDIEHECANFWWGVDNAKNKEEIADIPLQRNPEKRWTLSRHCSFKLNVDAAVDEKRHHFSIDGVVRENQCKQSLLNKKISTTWDFVQQLSGSV